MKTFNDFTGMDGIDKLMEFAPLIGEIVTDKDIFENMSKDTAWIEVGAKVYKAHKDACDILLHDLEYEPCTSIELMSSVAKILKEVFESKELMSFFISTSGVRKSLTSAMESTEAEQSKAS